MRVDTFYYWQEFLENTWGIFLRLLYLTQSYELLLLFSESRYLLLLTENYGALTILQQKMFTMDNAVVIFGSSFPRDQEYTQVFVMLLKIRELELGFSVLCVCLMVFNTIFNNISVISWWSVLLVEEIGENQRPATSHWQTLSHNVVHLTLIEI